MIHQSLLEAHELVRDSGLKLSVKLILLSQGESLKTKMISVLNPKLSIASVATIRHWIEQIPEVRRCRQLVIADPTADPRRYCTDTPWPIVQVPAHSIDAGRVSWNGWIDLNVPMTPPQCGGYMGILGIHMMD